MAKDPFTYFRPEAADLVGQLATGFLELEKRGVNAATIAKLFRVAHTLKGAARIVKHKELAELSHALETWMAPLREGAGPSAFDEALAIVDEMTAHVAQMLGTVPTAPAPVAPAAVAVEAPTVVAPIVLAVERTDLTSVLDGLAELQVRLAQLKGTGDLASLPARVEQLEGEVRRVREEVETLQLVPARALFGPLERLVRDTRAAADLTTHGGDVRLEAQVLAVLHAALVQLVRNALAHGLESPADRRAAGKPERARLGIALVQHGARVRIDCTDDGRGIDVAAVHRALVRRGAAVPPIEDRTAVMRALLDGGISTAAQVTELSGRGIGLDVVRDAAHQLGGEVTVMSEPGAGTTFSITVPVSLATMQVLLVGSGEHVVGLPLASIRRVGQLRPEHLVVHERSVALVQDDVSIPYATIHQLLHAEPRATTSVVVLANGVALGVERILGVHDVVHRARPAGVTLEPIVSGLIIDDMGIPRPALDPTELARAVTETVVEPAAPRVKPAPILVIDDSLTTRMLEQSILTSAGYDVELASSAEEGIAKAERGRYALFLVDVEMPGMDGFTFVAQTRAHPQLGKVPAILVTSRNAPEDRQRGASAGAAGYIVKGEFDQTELLALIARLV